MSWHGIRGHDEVVERFRRALARGRLATSFLFVGPEGVGKRAFALKLAQALLCSAHPESALEPCERCPSCLQVAAGSHPDVDVVAKPKDKSFLPLDLLIGDQDHRMREGLCHRIALKPFMGGRKVAVIDDADHLNAEGANCLLKTLEEPPPRSVLILIGTSPVKQLPTIRSRCQLVRFRPLADDDVAELLLEKQLVSDPAEARRLAAHAEGSLQRALDLADVDLWTFRERLDERLGEPVLDSLELSGAVLSFVEAAGREAPARRARLRLVVGFAVDFFRRVMHRLSGAPIGGDDLVRPSIERAVANGATIDAVAACLDRCLETAEQIDRNANATTLVECWLDDLARISGAARAAGRS
jgi:DNA polymerase-3 subunit delta'